MNNAIKKVFTNSILFSLGVIASKAIGFIMLPIYTHFLTSEEYGVATTVVAFIGTFSVVFTLSLRSAIMRFYNEYKCESERQKFIGSIIGCVIINSALMGATLLIFKDLLINVFFNGIDFYPMVLMGVIALFFDSIYSIYQSTIQAKQDGKKYMRNIVAYLLVVATLNSFFIIVLKMDASAMVLGTLCANIAFSLYGAYNLLNDKIMKVNFNKNYIVKALKYSLPILPHDLSNTIGTYLSKIILNTNISYASSGLFTVSSQISSIMNLVQASINLAFRPWFNEEIQKGEGGRKNIKRFSIITFSLYSAASIIISFFSQELLYFLVPQEYHEAWKITPILLFSLVISFIYYIHVLTIMYNVKASRFVSICSISGCVTNILLAYVLVPYIAAWGAAMANLGSQMVLVTITVMFSRKVEKVDFGLSIMIRQAIFIVVIMFIGLFPSYKFDIYGINWANITFKLSVILLSIVIVFWKEKKYVFNVLKEIKLKNMKRGK